MVFERNPDYYLINQNNEKLPYINSSLAEEVAKLLHFNLEDRARRGGAAKNKHRKES